VPIPRAEPTAAIVALVLLTLGIGIPVDAGGASWAQAAVSAWSWLALAWIASRVAPAHRLELAACVALATAGELFLKDVWGLYEYRLGNLPAFIPAGHALVFAAAVRMSRLTPPWFTTAVTSAFAVVVGWGAVRGYDTFGLIWFAAFAAYVRWSTNPRLCATLFVFALGIEAYGTSLGGWRYYTVEPWFGLTTTNPPVWIGAIYCTLETLVRLVAGRLGDGGIALQQGPRHATVVARMRPVRGL
jgi:hypothetical protein